MIRLLQPLDIFPLLPLLIKFPSEEVNTRDNLYSRQCPFLLLTSLWVQWFLPRQSRYTWVWAEGFRLCGVLSTITRSGRSAWEVEHLLLRGEKEAGCLALFDQLSVTAAGLGVERIFLRLPADSQVVSFAEKAGFSAYLVERLYERGATEKLGRCLAGLCLPRNKESGDEHAIFELYQAAAPVSVRSVEGLTLREWQEAREIVRKGKELVFVKKDSLIGWLRLSTKEDIGQFELMLHPKVEAELEQIVNYALTHLARCHRLFCLTPDSQQKFHRLLEEQRFEEITKYIVLVKQLAVRTKQPCLVPLSA